MVAFNGNKGYMSINGYVVDADFIEMELTRSRDTEDVTSGFGVEDVQRRGKLKDRKGKISLAWIEGQMPLRLHQMVKDEVIAVVYGPEGALSGKPRHDQDFIIKSISGPKQTVDKSKLVMALDVEQANAPRYDMYDGATWA